MEKLFIVVRADLSAGAQLAQACHTMRAFAFAHPELDRAWFQGPNNLVALQVPGLPALEALIDRAARAGVPHASFREPDFGDELTGVALAASGYRLVSSLPLALRPPRAA